MKFEPDGGLPFAGIRTFMKLPHSRDPKDLDEVDFAILGLPFDIGTTYRSGARFGPEAIRSISVRTYQYNPSLKINVFEHLKGLDYGDSQVLLGQTEASYDLMGDAVAVLVDHDVVPVVLGGDHSITYPELWALSRRYKDIALVHLDSHPDTWDTIYGTRYNHGTPFRRAIEEGFFNPEHSIHVGMRGTQHGPDSWDQSLELGLKMITMDDIDELGIDTVVQQIRERVEGRRVFLSFDIDVLDPAYAPGTGTPETGGLTSREALRILRGLAGLDFIGFDVVEVLPDKDPANITALAAAEVALTFLGLLAIAKRDGVS